MANDDGYFIYWAETRLWKDVGGESISPGEAVRLSLLFFCCVCPCMFDFFMVCVFVFLFNSFGVSLVFTLSSVALSSACLCAHLSVLMSLLFAVLAHISEAITIFWPKLFYMLLVKQCDQQSSAKFSSTGPQFDLWHFWDTFVILYLTRLTCVFVWMHSHLNEKISRPSLWEIHVRVFVCGCLSPFSLSQVRRPLTQLGSPLTPKTSHMTLVLFQTV